jgi:hypothetical protein
LFYAWGMTIAASLQAQNLDLRARARARTLREEELDRAQAEGALQQLASEREGGLEALRLEADLRRAARWLNPARNDARRQDQERERLEAPLKASLLIPLRV